MTSSSKVIGPARAPAISDYDMMFEVAELMKKTPAWTDASHLGISVSRDAVKSVWHPIHSYTDSFEVEEYLTEAGFKVKFDGAGRSCVCTISRAEFSTTTLPGDRNRMLCRAAIDTLKANPV